MADRTENTTFRNLLPVLVVALVIPVAYVLSYAPVVKLAGSWTTIPVQHLDGNWSRARAPISGSTGMPAYRPVDWLIDNTLLTHPLLWWAELWGVRDVFGEAVFWRHSGHDAAV